MDIFPEARGSEWLWPSVLLKAADLLILDEPTNHLDGQMADWLEDYLIRFRGALLMVTHDRYFLDRVTNQDRGSWIREKCTVIQDSYSEFVRY